MVSERVGQRRLSSTLHNNFCHFVGKQQFFGHFVLQELNKQLCFLPTLKNFQQTKSWNLKIIPIEKEHHQTTKLFVASMFVWGPKIFGISLLLPAKTDHRSPPKNLGGHLFSAFLGLMIPSRKGVPTGGANGCSPYFGHGAGTEHFAQSSSAPPCPTLCGNQGFSRVLLRYELVEGKKGKQKHQED